MISKNVFYSATFNQGRNPELQHAWGISDFDLSESIKDQIMALGVSKGASNVFNFRVVAFNNVTVEDEDVDVVTANDGKV